MKCGGRSTWARPSTSEKGSRLSRPVWLLAMAETCVNSTCCVGALLAKILACDTNLCE